jgi:hypothetical protein
MTRLSSRPGNDHNSQFRVLGYRLAGKLNSVAAVEVHVDQEQVEQCSRRAKRV